MQGGCHGEFFARPLELKSYCNAVPCSTRVAPACLRRPRQLLLCAALLVLLTRGFGPTCEASASVASLGEMRKRPASSKPSAGYATNWQPRSEFTVTYTSKDHVSPEAKQDVLRLLLEWKATLNKNSALESIGPWSNHQLALRYKRPIVPQSVIKTITWVWPQVLAQHKILPTFSWELANPAQGNAETVPADDPKTGAESGGSAAGAQVEGAGDKREDDEEVAEDAATNAGSAEVSRLEGASRPDGKAPEAQVASASHLEGASRPDEKAPETQDASASRAQRPNAPRGTPSIHAGLARSARMRFRWKRAVDEYAGCGYEITRCPSAVMDPRLETEIRQPDPPSPPPSQPSHQVMIKACASSGSPNQQLGTTALKGSRSLEVLLAKWRCTMMFQVSGGSL